MKDEEQEASAAAAGGATVERIAETIRAELQPHFAELARCRSSKELAANPLYRRMRPRVEDVLRTPQTEDFSDGAAPGKLSYRMVAWNLERGIEYNGQLKEFQTHPYLTSADVFLLTETDVGMARSGNRNITRSLARELGMYYVFTPCYLNLTKGAGVENEAKGSNEIGLHGNAILSRYPIRNARPVFLQNGRDKMRGREKRLGRQTAAAAEIVFPNAELTVCSVHLDAQSRRRRRHDQMRDVLDGLGDEGPAVIGGDWNTTTFNSSSAFPAIMGFWRRVFMGTHHVIENHFLRPYTRFERELFELLETRSFDWKRANSLDERTTSYDVDDVKTHKNLREWVPAWCFDFIRWSLRRHGGKCPLKIDWFATRGVEAVDPVVLHEFREGRKPLSDHDAIGLDILFGESREPQNYNGRD